MHPLLGPNDRYIEQVFYNPLVDLTLLQVEPESHFKTWAATHALTYNNAAVSTRACFVFDVLFSFISELQKGVCPESPTAS